MPFGKQGRLDRPGPVLAQGLRPAEAVRGGRGKKRTVAGHVSDCLRAFFDSEDARRLTCPDEADFHAMHEALGDREKQEEIRIGNPDGKHCTLLEASPNACIGCPKNAYEEKDKREEENKELIANNRELIETALDLGRLSRLGLLRAEDWSTTTVAAIAAERLRLEDARLLAKEIANEIGKVLSKMF